MDIRYSASPNDVKRYTTEELRKVYFSLAVRNMVSSAGLIFLLISKNHNRKPQHHQKKPPIKNRKL